MSKTMQNLVVLMEPSEWSPTWETSLKAGNMIFNRFCIDEDAAFELSGVNYLDEILMKSEGLNGMENSFLRSYFNSRILISMNN